MARYAHGKKDIAGHLRRKGIDLIEDLGPVCFASPHRMAADDGRSWSADRVILAVGGHAARLPIPGAELALTYEDIPSLTSLPGRVAVVGGARPEGFCKLIADRYDRTILGAHVVGEYSAETVQTVAAAMVAGMTVEQVAELQLAYPTFTEGVSMAAQKICRTIGIGRFPQVWSYLGSEE